MYKSKIVSGVIMFLSSLFLSVMIGAIFTGSSLSLMVGLATIPAIIGFTIMSLLIACSVRQKLQRDQLEKQQGVQAGPQQEAGKQSSTSSICEMVSKSPPKNPKVVWGGSSGKRYTKEEKQPKSSGWCCCP